MGTMASLKIAIIAQILFGVGLTMFTILLPAEMQQYMLVFSSPVETINMDYISSQIEESMDESTNTPSTDMSSLTFYSGLNILNLIVNIIFAVPQMFTLLISVLTTLLNLDVILQQQIKLFIFSTISIIYLIMVLQFFNSMRSGTPIT